MDNRQASGISRIIQQVETHRIIQHYASSSFKKNSKIKLEEKKQLLLDSVGMEFNLLTEFKEKLLNYSQTNFNQIGTGDNFTTEEISDTTGVKLAEKAAKPDRIIAVTALLDMLKTASANEAYHYVTSPSFKKLAGLNEFHFNLTKAHLSHIIQAFAVKYEKFVLINNNDNLLDVLLDAAVFSHLSDDELAYLFWQFNATLVADIIVNLYDKKSFQSIWLTWDKLAADHSFISNNSSLNYETLQLFLNNDKAVIEKINLIKRKLYAEIILPPNALSPGKNTAAEESLTPYQLYQYDEPTIFAVEQWLRDHYRHLLVNKIDTPNCLSLLKHLDSEAPYYFYQISSALYMLIDPDQTGNAHYYRYTKFKQDLSDLINSYAEDYFQYNKPVIFFGIINLYNIHYLPYFIHKDTQGKIHVLTVDPTARTYPDRSLASHACEDSKLNTRKSLQKIFQDILPGCDYIDANVNQMLRERDCGPNSGTTLLDALSSTLSGNPLLHIIKNQLILDEKILTINHSPIDINPYKGVFVYSDQLEILSLKSRADWEKRLEEIKQVSIFTIRSASIPPDAKLSIEDVYYSKEQIVIDYQYCELVEHQQQQDLRETNISAVQSLLLSKPENKEKIIKKLVTHYEQTLAFPDPTELADYIKQNTTAVTLPSLISAHQNNVQLLAEDVIVVILQDRIPNALIHSFKTTVLDLLSLHANLNAEKIVEDFLYQSENIFKKLSHHQQLSLKRELLRIAEDDIKQKLVHFYFDYIDQAFARNCRHYIAEMPPESADVAALIYRKDNWVDYEQLIDQEWLTKAYSYLKLHAEHDLIRLIDLYVREILDKVIKKINNRIHFLLDLENRSLDNLLSYISIETNQFIPWDIDKLSQFLAPSNSKIITKHELHSYLGKVLLDQLNQYLSDRVIYIIKIQVRKKVQCFIEQPEIKDNLTANQTITNLSSLLDDNEILLPNALDTNYIEMLIQQFGSKGTITKQVYSHPLVKTFLYFSLREGINEIIKSALHLHYHSEGLFILSVNDEVFAKNTLIDVNDAHQTATNFYKKLLSAGLYGGYFHTFLVDIGHDQVAFDQHGERFHQWFVDHHIMPLIQGFNKISHLKNNLEKSALILTALAAQTLLPKQLIAFLQKKDHYFREAIQALDSLPTNQGQDQLLDAKFLAQLHEICSLLFKTYSRGDLAPGTLASIIRPTLAQLLDIKMPVICTDEHDEECNVYRIDHAIERKIAWVTRLDNHQVKDKTDLIILSPCKQLPDTYNQPLTRALLIECVAYWYTNRPRLFATHSSFMSKLIKLVNSLPADRLQLEEAEVEKIDKLLPWQRTGDKFTVYASSSLPDKIMAALSITTPLTPFTETPLRFGAVNNMLAGNKPKAAHAGAKKTMTEPQLQKKITERMRQMQKTIKEGPALSTMGQPKNVTYMSVRQQILAEEYKISALSTEAPFTDALQNVKASELQPTGLFSYWDLTDIEKKLILIKNKHNNQSDFQLDSEDVFFLEQKVRDRWKKLVNLMGEDKAANHYLDSPNRKDKVYIAMAETLSKYYRSTGKHDSACYYLLMPTFKKFLPPKKLFHHTLPEQICTELNIALEETSIDDIPLKDLVILPTGYAINIDWINHQYQKNENLINHHTGKILTQAELDSICLHPKSALLLKMVGAKCVRELTPRCIELLVTYINNAIFSEGFAGNYGNDKNKKALDALTDFRISLEKLPRGERLCLLNESIPGDSRSVHDVFVTSQDKYFKKNKEVSEFSGENTCLTGQGVFLARLVIAYKGETHGIDNPDIVKRAKTVDITPREFKSTNEKPFSDIEGYLYDVYIDKTAPAATNKPGR